MRGLFVTGLLCATAAWAQDGMPAKGIYTCTTADGRKLTGDRPIPECTSREQRAVSYTHLTLPTICSV